MLTWSEFKDEVIRLAKTTPDFEYPVKQLRNEYGIANCKYNPDPEEGIPACIFGQALRNLKYPVPEFLEGECISYVLEKMSILPEKDLTKDRMSWVVTVQRNQDYGAPWGECI